MNFTISTAELLHLTGAMHKAIRELDSLIDRKSENAEQLKAIRNDLNSALIQTYGY